MVRKELGHEKNTSCVICSHSETVKILCQETTSEDRESWCVCKGELQNV
jgi:hypothetical protein